MGNKVIAIDNGFRNLKAKSEGKEVVYANTYQYGLTDEEFLKEGTSNVTYKSGNYTFGNGTEQSLIGATKDSDEHILSALTATTKFLTPNKLQNVFLVYGESPANYFNKAYKNELISKLEGQYTDLVVDGKSYKFNIEKVSVVPEGMGHILSDIENNLGLQYVIDIGGLTINFLTVRNGIPVESESMSTLLGVGDIKGKIANEYQKKYKINLKDDLIEEKLEKKGEGVEKDLQDIINNVIINQFKKFDVELWNRLKIKITDLLKIHNVTFVGGGSVLFKEYIEKAYKGAIIHDDALTANVRGFYEYGEAKYNREDD